MSDDRDAGADEAPAGNAERRNEGEGEDDGDPESFDRRVSRSFTCTLCGYATIHETAPLEAEVQGVCLNCGEWTSQLADEGELVETARDLAAALAGPVLTERQALAYLLGEVLDVNRQTAAEAMDSSPSNVDNLRRRGAEKVADAERIVDGLAALQPGDGGDGKGSGDENADGNENGERGEGPPDATDEDPPGDRPV